MFVKTQEDISNSLFIKVLRGVEEILSVAASSSLLLGISFFEFQNRYDQAGHLVWGMFDPQKDLRV